MFDVELGALLGPHLYRRQNGDEGSEMTVIGIMGVDYK